jgi:hypothetical protein
MEHVQPVLALPLLDRGDEPHDDAERQQDPAGPQHVHCQDAERVLVRRSDRRHHGDEVPQQQHGRELQARSPRQEVRDSESSACAGFLSAGNVP